MLKKNGKLYIANAPFIANYKNKYLKIDLNNVSFNNISNIKCK